MLELLTLRDELIGLRAEDAERRFRHQLLKLGYRDLRKQFEDQTVLLRENMTRAYEAETRVLELQSELEKLRGESEALVDLIHASRSWKLARIISAPVRMLKRVVRS